MRIQRPCTTCGVLHRRRSSYCPKCERERIRTKQWTTPQTYDKTYKRLRAAMIRMYGHQCQACGRPGRVQCHHINGHAHTWHNLILLCASCHGRVSNEQARSDPNGPMHQQIHKAVTARDA